MKIGFLVNHLAISQSNFRLIYNINKKYDEGTDVDFCVYYENVHKPCYNVKFTTSNCVDGWNYSGNLIATSIGSANKLIRFPKCKKYFYVFDLEWMSIPNKNYEELASIYQNDNLKLIARSNSHAKIIENAWNIKVREVVEDFNLDKIIKMIGEDENAIRKN